MKKWKYSHHNISTNTLNDSWLNTKGEEGWELIYMNINYKEGYCILTFKREITS
jgi:hypothetical protein